MLISNCFSKFSSVAAAALLLFSVPASQADPLTLDINHRANTIETSVELTQLVSFDLKIKFDNAVGLSAENFTVDAQLLSVTDPSLVSRLPDNLLTALPTAFPVQISITPDPNKGFSFSGAYEIEIYTKSLHYTEGSPLRLFHSHANGTFEDMTTMTGAGSMRVRGNGGQFSDFVILADLRSKSSVIATKFARMQNFVSAQQSNLDYSALNALATALNAIETALNANQTGQALAETQQLINLLEADDGTLFPNVWRSAGDLVNVQGRMLGMATTLRYSLRTL
ncbi:DUF6689 family protein [Pseudidiomarina terrestris]|uniref:Uncharacterized protein n=1 Tax=Pseudidiomarina terrestris TaxID=2820060 RepID=A0AAW7QYJ7_9GAMM|nr:MULTISPECIES: DUF6689 family protein [unclassified Pseudidiomarina]MDN7125300.1 hypothetical protein [Pseudidiomarina sp. 1APP75-32.1]MDN7127904.1 hypothetical protein [Pseudidiomarina sp. 1APR75-33.1]MDN7130059.1 hypothetical protein [Pseudidiomarina sp. 1APR75-15]MDN7135564.1 hypothetical protein [Pseudidiomarina sp. 1ASP75-5]MDN7137398.1 hypothetical protein [Pseudidiomarina sp. 1ASP75-14]